MGGTRFLIRGTLAWLPMPVIAVANAALREIALQPVFGAAAQPLSGLTLAALLALYSFVMLHRVLGRAPRPAAWLLGVIWTALTLAFEYILIAAQYANPVARLLDTLSSSALGAGNLFALAVLVVLLAPPLFAPRAAPST
jgi:hypothetical protein